jgi:glycosyltransferase involved in cell wall biosynthesis
MLLEPPAPTAAGTRPIRVLHVVQHLSGGGAETFVRGLVRGLHARDGLDVRVLSLYPDGLDAAARAELGAPVMSLERRGRADLAGFYPRLVAAVRAARPDIVHAHLHAGKYAGRIGALAAGVPAIVFTEHGDEAGGPVRLAVNRVLHPRTTRFIVFSEAQRSRFAASEGVPLERIVVIPNGVAEPPAAEREAVRAELGLAPDAFAVVVPARMTRQKNQVLALRAFATAFPRDGTARLLIAGNGALEGALRAEAGRLGIGERVVFLGFRADVARLLPGMDAFALPSVWERMPLALGEAMLAGLPVVTTPWAGHDGFVADGATGFVAADWSVAAFADGLRRARDAAHAMPVALRGRASAREAFGLEACVARHAALYGEVAARR